MSAVIAPVTWECSCTGHDRTKSIECQSSREGESGGRRVVRDVRPPGRADIVNAMIEAVIRTLTNTPLYPYWLYARRVDYFLFSDLLRRARGEVLDVGCGPRSYEQWIKQLCAVTGYTGLDMFHWDPAAASARQHRTSTDSLGEIGRASCRERV